ncbi:hypothetical protein [Nonomuraea soli]|uniref:Uncharacterized protein n=1 Tax=Nonomuraea soli TaxID=1032476 RepID=A0A7W0CIM2_9ACTN|nr:hypothetical protein [Nonomuraea soli]MBA2891635.1 hypothetical protein [Nonomuraea soli]
MRRELAAAVLGREVGTPGPDPANGDPLIAVSGEIRDVSPHLILVETIDGREERLVIAPWATAWHGVDMPPADLPVGSQVIMKTLHEGRVVERLWAGITRATGTILSVTGRRDLVVELDCGPHRGRRQVTIPYRATGRLRVRHPLLEPGFLFDAIGLREESGTTILLPATSQPGYPARAVPSPPPAFGGVQSRVSGSAVWSDAFDEEERGAAYPMVERSDVRCSHSEVSCVGLPYLAMGSLLSVHNVCTDRMTNVPITACGCVAGRFCDRCVECDTGSRGRIVELSPAAFVELGGELINGCFNARVGLG